MATRPERLSSLLDLPSEIRFRILVYVLWNPEPLVCEIEDPVHSPEVIPFPGLEPFPSIMYTNHQLHSESVAVMAEVNTLYIDVGHQNVSVYNLLDDLWVEEDLSVQTKVPILSIFNKVHINIFPRLTKKARQTQEHVETKELIPKLSYLVMLLNNHTDDESRPWTITVNAKIHNDCQPLIWDEFACSHLLRPFRGVKHLGSLGITDDQAQLPHGVEAWVGRINKCQRSRHNLDIIFDSLIIGFRSMFGPSDVFGPDRTAYSAQHQKFEFENFGEHQTLKECLPEWASSMMEEMEAAIDIDDEEVFFEVRERLLTRAEETVSAMWEMSSEYIWDSVVPILHTRILHQRSGTRPTDTHNPPHTGPLSNSTSTLVKTRSNDSSILYWPAKSF